MVLSPGFKQINNPVYSNHEAKMVHYVVDSDPTQEHESKIGSGIVSASHPGMEEVKAVSPVNRIFLNQRNQSSQGIH